MRRTVGYLVGLVLLVWTVALAVPASASVPPDDVDISEVAREAASEIADARERANAAADALFATESRIDRLELERRDLVEQIADLEAEVALLQQQVEDVAVARFARAGSSAMPLLTGFEEAGELAQVDVFIDIVNETSADAFDRFDVVSAELADVQAALNATEQATIAAKEEFERLRATAIAEVAHLKQVEAGRLEDDAVRRALEAEEAERRRQDEQEAAAAAAAAARAVDTPSNAQNSSSRPPGSTSAAGATADGTGPGGAVEGGEGGEGASGPMMLDGDAGDAGPVSGATGGLGGGQTGNDGLGGRSGVVDQNVDYGFDGWLCPVQGVVFFGDTWGAPRSGGRLHQGVDMIGEHGLPIVAVVDGFVQQKTNELGGNAAWLTGSDGNRYYYAHLDRWEATGAVTAGTVIGYVGQSGNAIYSVPHLHFQIHPGGGAAVNPYPTVRAHC